MADQPIERWRVELDTHYDEVEMWPAPRAVIQMRGRASHWMQLRVFYDDRLVFELRQRPHPEDGHVMYHHVIPGRRDEHPLMALLADANRGRQRSEIDDLAKQLRAVLSVHG